MKLTASCVDTHGAIKTMMILIFLFYPTLKINLIHFFRSFIINQL